MAQLNEIFGFESGPDLWKTLWSGKGGDWIDRIRSQGPRETLRDALIELPLRGRETHPSEPWGRSEETFQLGDYFLVWNLQKDTVAVVEKLV